MLPLLEFVFATPWRFAGTLALIATTAIPLSSFPAIVEIIRVRED